MMSPVVPMPATVREMWNWSACDPQTSSALDVPGRPCCSGRRARRWCPDPGELRGCGGGWEDDVLAVGADRTLLRRWPICPGVGATKRGDRRRASCRKMLELLASPVTMVAKHVRERDATRLLLRPLVQACRSRWPRTVGWANRDRRCMVPLYGARARAASDDDEPGQGGTRGEADDDVHASWTPPGTDRCWHAPGTSSSLEIGPERAR